MLRKHRAFSVVHAVRSLSVYPAFEPPLYARLSSGHCAYETYLVAPGGDGTTFKELSGGDRKGAAAEGWSVPPRVGRGLRSPSTGPGREASLAPLGDRGGEVKEVEAVVQTRAGVGLGLWPQASGPESLT